jgi:NADPH-dependent 2,4-dienoyl-CoA reductase/sulfur reductase-like enzyme
MRLVVIGGVAAGLSAAAQARRQDRSLEILVIEKGSTISYAACGLPYFIQGQVRQFDELVVHTPEYFARERNITVRTNAEVATIAHGRRQVALTGGERIAYDKLVVATGARPRRSGIAGLDQPHVFTLHTDRDALRLKAYLETRRPRRAVVIGGGYIGLECAEALRAQGLAVTLYNASTDLLGRDDAHLTKWIAGQLERSGVELRLGTAVTEIGPDRVLDTPCDLVLAAPGLQPNVELAAEAGIELGRTGAIRTDERLETNLGGVFAAGDCVETRHLVTGAPAWIPLGTTANKTGRIAGANAAGARERFTGIVGTSIVRVFGVAVAITGLSEAQARAAGMDAVSARVETRDRARYFDSRPTTVELVADRRTGRLLGGSVIGEFEVVGRINVIATGLTRGMQAGELAALDLAYSPPYNSVWDPIQIAAGKLVPGKL